MQYIAPRRIGFRFQSSDLSNPDCCGYCFDHPHVIGLAATQINVAVITRIASNDSGTVSYLDYAFDCCTPLGLFAIAIATVALLSLRERREAIVSISAYSFSARD
jgi:hypothetical protein